MAFEQAAVGNIANGSPVGPSGQMTGDAHLASGVFPGHPKEGDWFALKGDMLQPWEADGIESDSERGASRAHSPSPAIAPASTISVNTPLTMGGGTFAK